MTFFCGGVHLSFSLRGHIYTDIHAVDGCETDVLWGVGRSEMGRDGAYDLEFRLLDFSAEIVRIAELLPHTFSGRHVASQILRSGTSPMAQHGEAQSAESRRDFVHKLRIGLKELRETQQWLRLIRRVPLIGDLDRLERLISESDQLIKIFVASIRTATKNQASQKASQS